MATSEITKLPITIQRTSKTVALGANTDTTVSMSSVLSGTPKLLIVEGWAPTSTWATKLIVKQVNPATSTVYVRIDGSTAQSYQIYVTAVYW